MTTRLLIYISTFLVFTPLKATQKASPIIACTYIVGILNDNIQWENCPFEFEEINESIKNERVEFIVKNVTRDNFTVVFNTSAKVYKFGQDITLGDYKIRIKKSKTLIDLPKESWQYISVLKYKVVCSKLIQLYGQEYKNACLLANKKLNDEAEKSFSQLISKGLIWPEIFYARALTRMELNQFDDALKDLNFAIELYPNLKIAYSKRAFVQKRLGNITAAENDEKTYNLINNRLTN